MIELLNQAYPERPGLDTAISRAIVEAVGAGDLPETFRIHTTTGDAASLRSSARSTTGSG